MDLIDKAKNFVSEKLTNMEKPEATITDVDLKRIGFDGISFHAKVAVKNPYSVPVPIMEIDYILKSATRFDFLLLSLQHSYRLLWKMKIVWNFHPTPTALPITILCSESREWILKCYCVFYCILYLFDSTTQLRIYS